MTSNCSALSQLQRTALTEFMESRDRSRAVIFVGREVELDHVRMCVRQLLRRLDEPTPGADLTTVIQGAPGAGKSALLERIAEEWPPDGPASRPVAIRVAASSLELPIAELLAIMARQTAADPGIVRTLVRFLRSVSVNVAGLSTVTIGLDPDQLADSSLTPGDPAGGRDTVALGRSLVGGGTEAGGQQSAPTPYRGTWGARVSGLWWTGQQCGLIAHRRADPSGDGIGTDSVPVE